ncbi:hypothetical protein ABAC402_10405 [Asticcacaulis sp. AC402]|nr:hypothetical protein ABAC402_10405 [Asticcacaulis sp. AC402]
MRRQIKGNVMFRTIVAAVLALTVTAIPVAAKPVKPVVIGYIPTFKDYRPTLDVIDMSKLTHINISFVNPDAQGRFVNGDLLACSDGYAPDGGMTPAADIRNIVAKAHKHGVKVLVSLGGGTLPKCTGDWLDLLSDEKRATTVASLVKFAEDFDLDGIDVDLEWETLTAIDKAGRYVPFTEELNKALDKRGLLLTCATASNPGGMIPIGSIPHFDYINIMSYDGVGATWGPPGGENASMDMARKDIATWLARGAPKEKIVLGVPFYGRGFGTYAGQYTDYRSILERHGEKAAYSDVIGERCGGCSYITYSGRPTTRAKARLAAEQTAGVMIWELTEDVQGPYSLLDALHDSLHNE